MPEPILGHDGDAMTAIEYFEMAFIAHHENPNAITEYEVDNARRILRALIERENDRLGL